MHGEQEQRGQLAGERLGRGDADFGAGVSDDGAGGFARDHGADHVADGQRLRSLLFGFALRGQRVGGFARLRNHHGERVLADDWVAVTEFAAVIDLDGDAGQAFDHEFTGQRGVPAGAAGDDADAAEFLELAR